MSVTFYTILPDRFFGGDYYNPYTHTVNIYSDLPSVAIHEGGHAKDFEAQKWRGTYAALSIIPFTSLWFEAQATGDAIGYMQNNDLKEMEKESYRILYPAYATYISGEATGFTSYFTPIDPWIELAIKAGAVIPAHIIGRVKAAEVDDKSAEMSHAAP